MYRNFFHPKDPRLTCWASGVTLIEVLIAVAIIGVLVLPFTRFTTTLLKGFVSLDGKMKKEELTLRTLADLERDLKDMNEVIYCSDSQIDFYMDSHRAPLYDPKGDFDSDGIKNRDDPDDDADAFDHLRNARDYLTDSLNPLKIAVSTTGWRQGLDLQDDDDDNNGLRDVLCRYQYFPATQRLQRKFVYGYGALDETPWTTIMSNVVAFHFFPSGSPSIIDPNTFEPPFLTDDNSDGVLDVDELGGFPLDTFEKTRSISVIGYSVTIQPNLKRPETGTLESKVKPVLLAVKEKYP